MPILQLVLSDSVVVIYDTESDGERENEPDVDPRCEGEDNMPVLSMSFVLY